MITTISFRQKVADIVSGWKYRLRSCSCVRRHWMSSTMFAWRMITMSYSSTNRRRRLDSRVMFSSQHVVSHTMDSRLKWRSMLPGTSLREFPHISFWFSTLLSIQIFLSYISKKKKKWNHCSICDDRFRRNWLRATQS